MKKIYDNLFSDRKSPLNIVAEMWRMITWPYGYLVTSVIHFKDTYKIYIGIDASMADLMRPGMYWAYHHITVMWKENVTDTKLFDVTWALCENNDKFAVDRLLPANIERGDILVIHDAWAHGHSMWFNYNSMLRPAELLLTQDNTLKMIRRAETLNDYFATLEF
jgi:diaminopimelate decarboxylase